MNRGRCVTLRADAYLPKAAEPTLSERARRTKTVFDAVVALRDGGAECFRPGDVAGYLRGEDTPFGAWEVRGELANLERLGLVVLDEEFAVWRVVPGASFSIAAANAARQADNGDDSG